MLLLRNGVFGKHARSAAAVSQSHHCRVDIEKDVVFSMQVAVVGYGRQLMLRIGKGREGKRSGVGSRHGVASALGIGER